MFKKCPMCRHAWIDREDFLADPDVEIIGYQVSFDSVKEGLFLFNHHCETTLAFKVLEFEDLYEGARSDIAAAGTDNCSGFCLNIKELRACSTQCKYAYARDIIKIILSWPKR